MYAIRSYYVIKSRFQMKKFKFIFLFSLFSSVLFAQQESADVKAGNKLYNAKKYTEAEVAYRKGLQKNPKSFEANYNLGNARNNFV